MDPSGGPVMSPARESAAVARTIESLAHSGPMLTGPQRHNAAACSRLLKHDPALAGDLHDPIDQIVAMVTLTPNEIRPAWIASTVAAGVDAFVYLELVSIVARLQAIDTYHFALGLDPAPLTQPVDGPPTGNINRAARVNLGWLPTVGPASAPAALSALPGEHRLMFTIHDALYLSIEEMGDLDADRGLHRTQMELVAGRTSVLNDCFY